MIAIYIFIGFALGSGVSAYFINKQYSYLSEDYSKLLRECCKVKLDLLELKKTTPSRDPKTGRYIKNG